MLLSGGFTASAVGVYALLHAVGSPLVGGVIASRTAELVAGGVLALWVAADLGRFGLRTPMWRRQTPQQLFWRWGARRSALAWGLDAGLGFTTYRVTALGWAAFSVAVLGLVPWWTGIAYAAGFTLPAMAMVLLVRPFRPADGTPEPVWLLDRATALRLKLTGTAPVVMLVAAAACMGAAAA